IAALRRIRRERLGLNRRNHGYLFAYNPRTGYRVVDDKQATKAALAAGGVAAPALRHVCDAQWHVRGLAARLAAEREFVLKPARGAGGAGIVVIVDRSGERFVKASGATRGGRELRGPAREVLPAGCCTRRPPATSATPGGTCVAWRPASPPSASSCSSRRAARAAPASS